MLWFHCCVKDVPVHLLPLPGQMSGTSSRLGISIKPPRCFIFSPFLLPSLQPQQPSSQLVREEELMLTFFFFLSLVVPQMINRECGTCALPT